MPARKKSRIPKGPSLPLLRSDNVDAADAAADDDDEAGGDVVDDEDDGEEE